MKYDVVIYGHPALRKKAVPVARVDAALRRLADDMLETMRVHQGIGLAAEQIARTEAICVVDVPPTVGEDGVPVSLWPDVAMPLVLINPEIAESGGEQVGQEGCLSIPEVFVNIRRAERVTVRHLGLNGETVETRATGLLSRAIQHELDHLNGVLITDRMSMPQKMANAGKLKRLMKQQKG